MKIAIVNLIMRTIDNPPTILRAITYPKPYVKTDEDTNIIELGLALKNLGHEITIFASDAFIPEQSIGSSVSGLSVRYLQTRLTKIFPYLYFPFTPTLYAELINNGYDIVQSGEFCQIATVLSAIAARDAQFVVWHELGVQQRFPGNLVQNIYSKTLGKLIQRKIKCIIPRSYAAKDWLINNGIPDSKLSPVIHTGVNTKIFFPIHNSSNLRAKFGVPENCVLVVAVSRLHPYKGIDYLIKAMRLVVDKCPNVFLIIKGDGPQAALLNQLIISLGLKKQVKLIRRYLSRTELNELYNACDFTILPSTKELFPNFSVIESLACGKPVIHSSPGGHRDLGGEGYSSLYVEYGDIISLAEKILFIINNSATRKQMAQNALDLVKKEYSLDSVAKKLLNVYTLVKEY